MSETASEQSDKKLETAKATTDQPAAPSKVTRKFPRLSVGWWVILAVVAFFAVLGLCAAGSTVVHMATNTTTRVVGGIDGDRSFVTQTTGGGLRMGRMMGGRGDFDDTNTTSTTRVSGVVTAVDGSTITIAGNGTTVKVTVNDSTSYSGDDKPAAINDTIIAVGTTSGDTFTATRVVLQRQ